MFKHQNSIISEFPLRWLHALTVPEVMTYLFIPKYLTLYLRKCSVVNDDFLSMHVQRSRLHYHSVIYWNSWFVLYKYVGNFWYKTCSNCDLPYDTRDHKMSTDPVHSSNLVPFLDSLYIHNSICSRCRNFSPILSKLGK